MKQKSITSKVLLVASAAACIGLAAITVGATEPCGDFGECKVLVEINSTDGDIGFHFLMDGDDLKTAELGDPDGGTIFKYKVAGPLREQYLTETFAESAEPLCWDDPDAELDEDIVTLEDFLERWSDGVYRFAGKSDDESSVGESLLTFDLPAAPADLEYDGDTRVISWAPGDDLGNCATNAELTALVDEGTLTTHPEDVAVASWEAVFEPDVEDGDPTGSLKFTIRVPAGQTSVTVPADYLASLPVDTPVKVEVGAIGMDDNATFAEEDGFCINEDEGCEDED